MRPQAQVDTDRHDSDMNLSETTSFSPAMWRVGAVARQFFGLSEAAFVAACDRGDLPIQVERIGAGRIRMVRSAEVRSYLQARHSTPEAHK